MRKSKQQLLVTQWNILCIATLQTLQCNSLSFSFSFLATAIEVDCDLQNKFASITINFVFAVCFGRFIRLWFVHFIPFLLSLLQSFIFSAAAFYLYYHFYPSCPQRTIAAESSCITCICIWIAGSLVHQFS